MKFVSLPLFLILLLCSNFVQASDKTLSISDAKTLVDTITRIYSPIFADRGFQFKIISLWNRSTTNAYAYVDESSPKIRGIMLYGGLIRTTYMTRDLLAFTLCHEIGHHLATQVIIPGSLGFAAEGEADYFASSVCLKKILPELPTESASESSVCRATYVSVDDQEICGRTSEIAQDFGRWFAAYTSSKDIARIETPLDSKSDAPKTLMDHASAQCRVDTIFQGALEGGRPRCWFHP